MQLKVLTHLTVVTTVLFFNAKISLAESIKVPYVSISGFQAPLWLGEKAGAFRRNQLEVQLIYMPGGSLIVQTLLSGEVGIASLAPPSAISAWTKGSRTGFGRRRYRTRSQRSHGLSQDQNTG